MNRRGKTVIRILPVILVVILAAGCYLDQRLAKSVRKKEWDVALHLLDQGADPDTPVRLSFGRRSTTLIQAAKKGRADVVRAALNCGADPNAVNSRGQTALQQLGWGGSDLEIAEYLVMMGADVNFTQKNTLSPLMLAVNSGNEPLVYFYLENGAEINTRSGAGLETPLMSGCQSGHESIVRILLDSGADPDLQDAAGRTALMTAALTGKTHIVDILTETGADTGIRDTEGRDYLDYAVMYEESLEAETEADS
jgi:ankyrin repeat protein